MKTHFLHVLMLVLVLLCAVCACHAASGETATATEAKSTSGPKVIPLWDGDAPYSDESPDQPQPILTIYNADESKRTNIALIICPGGAYAELNSGRSMAKRMRNNGISAYILSYRVAPCNCLAPLADVRRAVRVVRNEGFEYVGVLGLSAGGHLACMAATHWEPGNPSAEDPIDRMSSRPDYFVACYPVVSFTRFPQQRSVLNLLGDRADDPDLLEFFSVESHVTPETPPGYIWHCEGDTRVSAQQSMILAEALLEAGVPCELHLFPGGAHGIGLAKSYPSIKNWPTECISFIKRICK